MTSEKQLPFEQNTRKEVKDKGKNIEGHSGEVGLQARTRSTTNDRINDVALIWVVQRTDNGAQGVKQKK
jgi:hypothetical protein